MAYAAIRSRGRDREHLRDDKRKDEEREARVVEGRHRYLGNLCSCCVVSSVVARKARDPFAAKAHEGVRARKAGEGSRPRVLRSVRSRLVVCCNPRHLPFFPPQHFLQQGDGRQPHAPAECGVVGEGEGKGKRERALSERPVTSRRGMQ